MNLFSTVAAISTPYGRGGIAVIRISGSDALAIADKMFSPACGKLLSTLPPKSAVFGSVLRDGNVIDTAIATAFRAPASFTGEDTVEISCHGGILLTQTVLETAFLCGAVPAGPGEFTKRAFLNGKLSLTEAEGVIDLIDAESDAQIKLASAQSRGRLSGELDRLCKEIRHLLASVYAFIDYPDEDLTEIGTKEMQERLQVLLRDAARLKATYRTGKAIKEGIETVLIGKPNTGKSSLLNLLLGEDRAIVTDIPGTTRDTIEESAKLGSLMLRLCDTAGIREGGDAVEAIGIERSLRKIQDAELIIGVFDASAPLDAEDERVLLHLCRAAEAGKQVLCCLNKTDCGMHLSPSDFLASVSSLSPQQFPISPDQILPISVKETPDQTLASLTEHLTARFLDGSISVTNDAILTNARQFAAISDAVDAMTRARDALAAGLTQDLAGMDLELALGALRSTDGSEAVGEIVDEIFSRFCIGK